MFSQGENLLGEHFARLMVKKSGVQEAYRDKFNELILKLVESMGQGNSCLPVNDEDEALLKNCNIVSEGAMTPLVLYGGRLYLHRYFNYESRLAAQLQRLSSLCFSHSDTHIHLDSLFAGQDGQADLQRKAAKLAAEKHLAIISGGPGTGKTSTVVRIIELLLRLYQGQLKIALAAPTGKAAMRLQQSLKHTLFSLKAAPEHIGHFPSTASTIHRLLGVSGRSLQFMHNSENRLDFDVVIVDEASMIDLALMSKLVDGLKKDSRLILLGDKDQLASVESGSVLADMIESLPLNTVLLQKSYRFDSGIKALADSVNSGDCAKAWQYLQEEQIQNVGILSESLLPSIGSGYKKYIECVRAKSCCSPENVFREFSKFRVLCATRLGIRGTEYINAKIEDELKKSAGDTAAWYPGRPVIITRNCYHLGLYNGDIGICLEDKTAAGESGKLKVWFEDSEGGVRSFLPYRIPEHQTAFAMTIHKSQGSEFEQVIVILPDDDNQVLSRELIYTAITRAKSRLWVKAGKRIFSAAVSSRTERNSGLASMLRV